MPGLGVATAAAFTALLAFGRALGIVRRRARSAVEMAVLLMAAALALAALTEGLPTLHRVGRLAWPLLPGLLALAATHLVRTPPSLGPVLLLIGALLAAAEALWEVLPPGTLAGVGALGLVALSWWLLSSAPAASPLSRPRARLGAGTALLWAALLAWAAVEAQGRVLEAPGLQDALAVAATALALPAFAPPAGLRRLLRAGQVQEALTLLREGQDADDVVDRTTRAAAVALGTDRTGAVWLDRRGPATVVEEAQYLLRGRGVRLRPKDVPPGMQRYIPGSHRHGLLLASLPTDPAVLLYAVPEPTAGHPAEALAVLEQVAAQATPLLDHVLALAQAHGVARESQQRARSRSRFLGSVAHELGNPLSPIQLQLTVLERGIDDPAKREKALGVIQRNVQRLSKLVGDMKTVARLEEERFDLDRQEFDLADLVAEAVGSYQEMAQRHGCTLRITETEPVPVHADRERLGQVLDNLLSNAIKYSPEGGEVSVLCAREHGQALVGVQDQGLGLTEAQQAEVFGGYHRVHEQEHPEIGGTGLGLAIVLGIVEAHGGQVRAYSAGPGQGSTFTIRIPRQ